MTPDDIRVALDRTFGGCCVRVEYVLRPRLPRLPGRRRHGGMLRPLIDAAAKRAREAVAEHAMRGHGVVDLDSRRCAVVSNGHGELVEGERVWRAAAGRRVDARDESRFGDLNPLLALELLRGAVEVAPGKEATVYCDLVAAAEAVGGDMRVPSSAYLVSLLRRVPLHVTFGADGEIHSVRHEADFGSFTLDVVERGVPEPDWTRIPDDA